MSELVIAAPPPAPTTRSRAATREVWLDRLTRFPLSGLTPAQFCALEAVSLPSFYSWKRRFAAEALATDSALDTLQHSRTTLLPVRLPAATASLELVLSSGLVLRIPPCADLAWVRSLVAALGDPSC